MNVRCPICGWTGEAPTPWAGKKVKCPRCEEKFRLPATSAENGTPAIGSWTRTNLPPPDENPPTGVPESAAMPQATDSLLITSEAAHLTPCPGCGHPISPRAATCPNCGHPLAATTIEKTSKSIKSALVIFTCLFLVSMVGCTATQGYVKGIWGALGWIGLIGMFAAKFQAWWQHG